jgi:uncharacterized protein YecT (DUF1311 family)
MKIAFLALTLALLGAAGSAAAQEARPSQAACDTKKLGGRELADCLRVAAARADADLRSAVEAAMKSVDGRAGLLTSQKARWRRSLNEAQAQWVTWRDTECQDVAPFEAGMAAKGGDPRLNCIIDYDAARAADLKARYQ